jgi:hypothetical protein
MTARVFSGEDLDRPETAEQFAPNESISLDFEINATEESAQVDSTAGTTSIAPQLAALELIASPTREQIIHRGQKLSQGRVEIDPIAAPVISFVWRPKQVLPVRVSLWAETDATFDHSMNQISATVIIEMRVLAYCDVAPDVKAYNEFLARHHSVEAMARELARSA